MRSLPGRLLASTFAIPSLLALASLLGLVVALVGDGVFDAAGWLGLCAPVVAIVLPALRARVRFSRQVSRQVSRHGVPDPLQAGARRR